MRAIRAAAIGGVLLTLLLNPASRGQEPKWHERVAPPIHPQINVPLRPRGELERDVMRQFAAPATRPSEVFVLERQSPGGPPGQRIEVRVWGERAEVKLIGFEQGQRRHFARALEAREIADLRAFLKRSAADEMESRPFQGWDGVEYVYLHATPGEAWRVLVNNPHEENPNDGPFLKVIERFKALADPASLRVVYAEGVVPPGADVLYAAPDKTVNAVWAKGDDVRVEVHGAYLTDHKWYALRDGRLVETTVPDEYKTGPREDEHGRVWSQRPPLGLAPARWQGNTVLSGSLTPAWRDSAGTWLFDDAAAARPRKLLDGMLQHYLIPPGGRHLVGVLEADGELVSLDLESDRRVPIEPRFAFRYVPREWIETRGRVLLVGYDVGPDGPSRYPRMALLDPATGRVEDLDREADPRGLGFHRRALQPVSGEPDTVWAAFAEDGYTTVGRFDRRRLNFRGWWTLKGPGFGIDRCWVDESTRRLYYIDAGDLFRIPLDEAVFKDLK